MDASPGTTHQDVRADVVRVRGLVPTELGLACGKRIEVVVRNVSRCGLGATATCILPEQGASVTLTLASGHEIRGFIQWVKDRNFGVRFDEELATDSLKALQSIRKTNAKADAWEVSRLHHVSRPIETTKFMRPV